MTHSATTEQLAPAEGFEPFWDSLDAELARFAAAPELERLARAASELADVYLVRLTSVGPYRISGYLTVPLRPGPHPGLLLTPRYGSVNHIPHPDDQRRFVVLQLIHRGQRLADQPYAARYPGLLTDGIEEPDSYVYRGIVADCLRGLEFLLGRGDVRSDAVGIVGDDLALITAARRPMVECVQAAALLLYRLAEAHQRTGAYPAAEIGDYLRARPTAEMNILRTLAFFDPLHHAGSVRAKVHLSVGDPGAADGPEWLEPLVRALGGPVILDPQTHETAVDRDRADAWLAEELGVEPRPRLWSLR